MAYVDEILKTLPRRTFDNPDHDLARREDRRLKLRQGTVWSFKRDHKLPRDKPLSPAAEALLLQQLETAHRVEKGEAIKRAEALQALERITPEQAAAVAAAVPTCVRLMDAGAFVSLFTAERYLLDRVEQLTGKRYSSSGRALKRCQALVPAAAAAEPPIEHGYLAPRRLGQAIYWGVILRLDHLQGPPPPDPAAFYQWSLLAAYDGHEPPSRRLSDALSGRLGEDQARTMLGLPVSGPLAPGAVRSAYRQLAAKHHPDAGGDPARFDQLTQARDRLLEVANLPEEHP